MNLWSGYLWNGPQIEYNQYKNLYGKKFNRLVVIKQIGVYGNSGKLLCKCDCGNEIVVLSSNLLNNSKTSCGCLKKFVIGNGTDLIKTKYRQYRRRAKNKKLVFDLTFEQFGQYILDNCYYCNKIPTNCSNIKGAKNPLVYNGIDRVDNEKGYTIDNCVTCCKDCNYKKASITRHIAEKMVKFLNNKD